MRVAAIILLLCASVSGSEITDAIGELGAEQFATREAGVQHLVKLAERDSDGVLRECVRSYWQSSDPEVKVRLRSTMQQVVDQYIYRAPRGFLGIRLQGGNIIIGGGGKLVINGVTVPPDAVWVTGTVENSAAERLGILPNDFILAVDGKRMTTTTEFTGYIQSRRPGVKVQLRVLRGERTNQMEAVLGELPQETRDQILTESGSHDFFMNWLSEQLSRLSSNAVPAVGK